jgi:hypothetical protein
LLSGTATPVCGFLSLCLVLPSIVGLPLGLLTWAMANRDSKQMEAGLLDPTGEAEAGTARGRAFCGIALCLLSWTYVPLWIGVLASLSDL